MAVDCSRFRIPSVDDNDTAARDDLLRRVQNRLVLLDRLLPSTDVTLANPGLADVTVTGLAGDSDPRELPQMRPTSALTPRADSLQHLPTPLPPTVSRASSHRSSKLSRQVSGRGSTSKLKQLLQIKVQHKSQSADAESPTHLKSAQEHWLPDDSLPAAPGSLLGTPALSAVYSILQRIGEGHSGTVTLVRCRSTKKLFACKTVSKASMRQSPRALGEVKAEVLALAQMQLSGALTCGPHCGPFVVKLHEVLDDSEAVHLVTEYCEGGDLLHHVIQKGRLPEAECATMLMQLLTGLSDLHRMGIIHRDIKPENILITNSARKEKPSLPAGVAHLFSHGHRTATFKLADLGTCAHPSNSGTVEGIAGSPKYMAPEVIDGKSYDAEVDVWSLGVVLYSCLTGKQPFFGAEMEDVFKAVRLCQPDLWSYQRWAGVSSEAKCLVSAMLCKDPAKRITVAGALFHPWLVKFSSGASTAKQLQPLLTLQPIRLRC